MQKLKELSRKVGDDLKIFDREICALLYNGLMVGSTRYKENMDKSFKTKKTGIHTWIWIRIITDANPEH